MKQKPFFLTWNERQRISEALGILVADQAEGRRGYLNDLKLMNKWDSLLENPKKVQIIRPRRSK